MKIVIGSNNTPKRNAVESAFTAAFPDADITIETVSAASGVSSHPTTGEESLASALARANHAKQLSPGADYYVGIEGGLLQTSGRTWEVAWVVITNSEGKVSTGLSSGVEVRGKILKSILDGVELSEVLHNDFGIESAGNTNGFYGIVTNDLVTRQAACVQGVTFALAPFLHPEFYTEQ